MLVDALGCLRSGINDHSLDVRRFEQVSLPGRLQDLFEQFLYTIGPDPVPPFDERGRVTGKVVLEVCLAAKELPVGVLDPLGDDRLVALVVERLEVMQADQ